VPRYLARPGLVEDGQTVAHQPASRAGSWRPRGPSRRRQHRRTGNRIVLADPEVSGHAVLPCGFPSRTLSGCEAGEEGRRLHSPRPTTQRHLEPHAVGRPRCAAPAGSAVPSLQTRTTTDQGAPVPGSVGTGTTNAGFDAHRRPRSGPAGRRPPHSRRRLWRSWRFPTQAGTQTSQTPAAASADHRSSTPTPARRFRIGKRSGMSISRAPPVGRPRACSRSCAETSRCPCRASGGSGAAGPASLVLVVCARASPSSSLVPSIPRARDIDDVDGIVAWLNTGVAVAPTRSSLAAASAGCQDLAGGHVVMFWGDRRRPQLGEALLHGGSGVAVPTRRPPVMIAIFATARRGPAPRSS